MMCKISYDELLTAYIEKNLKEYYWAYNSIDNWDCQDTECDNNTECYFYLDINTDPEILLIIINELKGLFKIECDSQCYFVEKNKELNQIRIEFIVHIGPDETDSE